MKSKFLIALSLLFISTALFSKGHDIALLVRSGDHIKAGLKTFQSMREPGSEVTYGQGVIIVCGAGGVRSLTKAGALKEVITQLKALKVQVKACGMSLNKAKIKRDSLLEGIQVVENGLYELIRLKSQGHLGVDL